MTPRIPALILFDGTCNLCNAGVRFIYERDRDGYFRFASLQSEAGRKALAPYGGTTDPPASMVLIDETGKHEASDAALRVARKLRAPWPLLGAFGIVPRPLRDAAYRFGASNRYRWFGRRDVCTLPGADMADMSARFL